MKILLITWACDLEDVSEPGVSARWVEELSKEHKVTLFSVSKPERYGCVKSQFAHLNVIEWKDIWVPRFLWRFRAVAKPGYLIYYLKARLFLKKFVKENHFDVIHHLSPFSWRYPSPAIKLGIPLVRGPLAGGLKTPNTLRIVKKDSSLIWRMMRNTDKLRIKFDYILRQSFYNTDVTILAAPYVSSILSDLLVKNTVIEIEHGVNIYNSEQRNKNSEGNTGSVQLIYVGRVIKTKGLRYAIKALSRLKSQKDIKLVVIGSGDDLEECQILAKKLQIQDKVQFLGWCSPDEVHKRYKESDIFIFPSVREPTGGVLLEAMSHGLPTITCAYGGPDYMIDDGCGIKVEISDDEAFTKGFSDAIETLVENRELRNKMSCNALKRVKNDFDWKSKLNRINDIYLLACKAHGESEAEKI